MPLTSSSNAFVFGFFSQLLSLWPFETETVSTVSTLNAAIHEVSRSLTKSQEVSLCLQTSLGTSPHHRNANPPWQLGNSGSIEQREQPQIILIKMLNHGKHGKE